MQTRVEGLVLRASREGEADRLLEIFTRERGRVRALARSANKPTSRWRGCAEPFALIRTELESRSREPGRYILGPSELVQGHSGLRSSLKRLSAAAEICEMLLKGLPEREPHGEILDLALHALGRMEAGASEELWVLVFQIRLLRELGVFPHLSGCSLCGKPYPGTRKALFSPHAGGLVCRECSIRYADSLELSTETMSLLAAAYHRSLEEIDALSPGEDAIRSARTAFRRHIEFHLEWSPETQDWLKPR